MIADKTTFIRCTLPYSTMCVYMHIHSVCLSHAQLSFIFSFELKECDSNQYLNASTKQISFGRVGIIKTISRKFHSVFVL
jgi:hypothetical protein